MKKIGLVFLSLILTVVVLVACKPKPTKKLSIEDRLAGEYKSDLGTWEFDKNGDVYFSGLKGSWWIDDESTDDESTDDESTDDESTDDESSESDSPQKINILFFEYNKEDESVISMSFNSKIERNDKNSYEKLSKLSLNLENSRFDDHKSLEEKFDGIHVVRLTRKQ